MSKSISVKVDGPHVRLRATDHDSYLESSIPLLNEQDILTDHLVIPLDVIVKVIKAVSSRLVFLKRDGKYFIYLVGGEIILETFTIDEEKFTCPDEVESAGIVKADKLYKTIKDMVGLVTTSVNPPERRILFENGLCLC